MMRPPKSLDPPVVLPSVMIGITFPAASVVTPMTPRALNRHQDRAGRQRGHRRHRHVQAGRQVADEQAPAVVRGWHWAR